jgi:hypothetical protein
VFDCAKGDQMLGFGYRLEPVKDDEPTGCWALLADPEGMAAKLL